MKKLIIVTLLLAHTTTTLCSFSVKNIITQLYKKKTKPINPQIAFLEIDNEIDIKITLNNLMTVKRNSDIHGIILLVNSSGGSAALFSCIHDTLKHIGVTKPIVALVTGTALSGGYWVSSIAHYIYAHSACEIGGIGAIIVAERFKNTKYNQPHFKADVDLTLFKAGKFKTATNPSSKIFSQEEKQYLQGRTDDMYQYFISVVAHNRKLKKEAASTWAEGKFFMAEEARNLGLIDDVGTIFNAEEKIVELLRTKNPTTRYLDDIIQIPVPTHNENTPPKNNS